VRKVGAASCVASSSCGSCVAGNADCKPLEPEVAPAELRAWAGQACLPASARARAWLAELSGVQP